ncbi:hypothetical protein JKP88DRAFT_198712 [Tribonema minus]|uniref:NAD(P)-binding domain-containing protein n=1 Tax=Tribonema minus TaxID=303371 RepID=A0A835YZL1_9STRA|nr:hypothetical protein JKP88DRAFT_198712 [Tribonema minus]
MASKVVVTGAGGKTGSLVFKKLLERPGYEPVGLVRTEKSAKKLRKFLGADLAPSAQIALGNVNDAAALDGVMAGADAVVLCSSATPKIRLLSLLLVLLNPLRKLLRLAPARPSFTFGGGGIPEKVDWLGAKEQVDSAKRACVKKFVFVSSMGGTQPDNFLNTIGRKKDGTGGDILLWKRKAEEYLIESGVPYTILHPGGLLDQPGGKRELLLGKDDAFLATQDTRSVPREDVAEVCVQALSLDEATNRSLDLVSRKEGEGAVTTDFAELFRSVEGTCNYTAMPR